MPMTLGRLAICVLAEVTRRTLPVLLEYALQKFIEKQGYKENDDIY